MLAARAWWQRGSVEISYRSGRGCCNHVEPLTDSQDKACCPR